ncbi:hypothetical protein P1P75_00895 [Streptomyces sp. ID05-39B]|uniref:hypothetical protein n=1 Tax=Streptomyces sp. ID05-39B TaxID=3028664 RepID=UPI0029B9F933|nr:hypothetical protein [Streptomyces sp. ID05-39B]MDX3525045.1 hypothetical protein [Streptomyces sp. ID05-39B]
MNIIEITNAYESAEEARADWSLTEDPEVQAIARRAARGASTSYGLTLEPEDAYQEALLFIATRPDRARTAYDTGPGVLHTWIGQRLRDKHLTEARRRSEHKSWEVNQDQLVSQGY